MFYNVKVNNMVCILLMKNDKMTLTLLFLQSAMQQ